MIFFSFFRNQDEDCSRRQIQRNWKNIQKMNKNWEKKKTKKKKQKKKKKKKTDCKNKQIN